MFLLIRGICRLAGPKFSHVFVDWLLRIVCDLLFRKLGLGVGLIFLLISGVWRVVGVVDVQRVLHGGYPCVECLGPFCQVPDVIAEPSPDFCALQLSLMSDAFPILVYFGQHWEEVDKEIVEGAEFSSLQRVGNHVVQQAVGDGGPVGAVEFVCESVNNRGRLRFNFWHLV